MRIAILNKYQNKVARGAETFVAELSSRLSKKHEVDVISAINYWNIIKNKYDVIIPTNGRSQVVIVRILSWLTRSKIIVSGQSGPGIDDRINLYTFPNAFVALTTFQATWAKKINPLVKIVTIPNGVDLNFFSEMKRNKPKNVVLSVGAFTKDKRHDLTIKAVSKLKNIKLVIVGGGGDLKDHIKNLGLNLLGRDRFEIKTVKHDQMPAVYNEATLMVFSTVPWESFGIALVEAMACGLPVVASNDPIRKEIVGDAGLLENPENINNYAKAIEKAISKSWGNAPRRQAEKFSWNDIANKYEKLIEDIFV